MDSGFSAYERNWFASFPNFRIDALSRKIVTLVNRKMSESDEFTRKRVLENVLSETCCEGRDILDYAWEEANKLFSDSSLDKPEYALGLAIKNAISYLDGESFSRECDKFAEEIYGWVSRMERTHRALEEEQRLGKEYLRASLVDFVYWLGDSIKKFI